MIPDILLRSTYHYELPSELIAQYPLPQRQDSRLMVVDRKSGEIQHRHFTDILEYLSPGDVLVVNTTKVIPARIYGHKSTGANIEVLLLHPAIRRGGLSARPSTSEWCCLVKPSNKLKIGDRILFTPDLSAEYIDIGNDGIRTLKFTCSKDFMQMINEIGEIPLPHYIKRKPDRSDLDRYQTIYAKDAGSVAAPTAGLHFTPDIFDKINQKGIILSEVSLNVGAGTFRPVKVDNISEHKMHAEYCTMPEKTANIINSAKQKGNRVIAVGTTSARTIESFTTMLVGTPFMVSETNHTVGMPFMASEICNSGSKWTDLFIYPGKDFKTTDALITNFHLPESTLLMLVCAFAGYDLTMRAYQTAVNERYRFFSYGDAMLIL